MNYFSRLLRTRLALRSAAITLSAVSLLGIVSLFAAVFVAEERERRREEERLGQLLDTIERTAQIACFLNNSELAAEVATGLLNNSIVREVSFLQQGQLLIHRGREAAGSSRLSPVERIIHSPFDASEEICRVVITPDADEIQKSVVQASAFITLLLSLQLVGIGVVVMLVIIIFVTRPIRQVSQRLNQLEAETGQKLRAPKGNEQDEIGRLVASVNAMIDRLVSAITIERQLRLEREVEERRFRTIFENVETGIFELDLDGRVAAANPAFHRIFGLPQNSGTPMPLGDVVSNPESLETALQSLAADGSSVQFELELERRGTRNWISVVLNRIEARRLQGVANDVTERRLAAESAERMALTDALTGLGNRRGLQRRMAAMIRERDQRENHCSAVIMLDLDQFKEANDTYGHAVGDKVLQQVGRVLNELVREADYVARLGGDEFVVLLDGVSAREEVVAVIERFLGRINEPLQLGEARIKVGASLGIAILGQDADNDQELLALADAAMYRAKHAGRNTYRFHEQTLLA